MPLINVKTMRNANNGAEGMFPAEKWEAAFIPANKNSILSKYFFCRQNKWVKIQK